MYIYIYNFHGFLTKNKLKIMISTCKIQLNTRNSQHFKY